MIDPICFQLHLKNILYNFHMQRMDKRLQKDVQWTNPLSVEGIVNLAGTEVCHHINMYLCVIHYLYIEKSCS